MLNPQFPYSGSQVIVSSDRVTLHSKKDAVFILGKAAIGLSSTDTINLDANKKVLIACDKIELGYKAEENGQPVVLGNTLNERMVLLLGQLSTAGDLLEKASTTNLGTAMIAIHTAGKTIKSACDELKELLERTDGSGKSNSPILSKNTYTM